MKIIIPILFLIALNIPVLSQKAGSITDLNSVFRRFSLVSLDTQAILSRANTGQNFSITIDGNPVTVSVTPHDLRAFNYRLTARTTSGEIEIPRPQNTTFKGSVVGATSSKVRLALTSSKIEGLIKTGNREYFIEPARAYLPDAPSDQFVIYEQRDVINTREIACPLLDRVSSGMRSVKNQFRDRKPTDFFTKVSYQPKNIFQPPPGDVVLDLSTDADLEYVKIFGNGHATLYALITANQNINEILNVVEGLYEDIVDVTFNIPYQGGWMIQDPYGLDPNGNNCPDSLCVIGNFKNWWNLNRPHATFDGRDAALLFTGKAVDDNMAYVGVLCVFPDFSYGIIVGDFPVQGWGNTRYGSTAHEIAHLFGANHVDLNANPDCYNSFMGLADPKRPHFGEFRMCNFTINEIDSYLGLNNTCLPVEP